MLKGVQLKKESFNYKSISKKPNNPVNDIWITKKALKTDKELGINDFI